MHTGKKEKSERERERERERVAYVHVQYAGAEQNSLYVFDAILAWARALNERRRAATPSSQLRKAERELVLAPASGFASYLSQTLLPTVHLSLSLSLLPTSLLKSYE
jgi:hypothetical protein